MSEKGASGKGKTGRRVQFTTHGLPEDIIHNGGVQSVVANGGLGKGGKADKVGKGGKVGPKEAQPLELNMESELPDNAKCLMDSEAANIVGGVEELMVVLSGDPAIKLAPSFARAVQYAKSSTRYSNTESVRKLLQTLTKYGVSDGEICVIANCCPESADEVFALVPSLQFRRTILRKPLEEVLSGIAKYKRSS